MDTLPFYGTQPTETQKENLRIKTDMSVLQAIEYSDEWKQLNIFASVFDPVQEINPP